MEFKLQRIKAIMLRYFYSHKNTPSSYFDFLYWPLIDTFLFGFIGVSLSSGNIQGAINLFTGIVLWQVAFRSSLEVSKNIVQELWDENLLNFLATPVSTLEWIIGLMTTGCCAICITLPYGALLVYLIYGYTIFAMGPSIIIYVLLLILSGWALGFTAASFLISLGQKIESIMWAIGWLPTPFCSVYYPIEALPHWMQVVSKALPMSYAFEGMRITIKTGTIALWHVGISLLLNLIYLSLALTFFWCMFKKSKQQGLSYN